MGKGVLSYPLKPSSSSFLVSHIYYYIHNLISPSQSSTVRKGGKTWGRKERKMIGRFLLFLVCSGCQEGTAFLNEHKYTASITSWNPKVIVKVCG
jgi:hypothetical protein